MPNVYIEEDIFARYVEKYGYNEAKKAIRDVVEKNAPKLDQR